MLEDVGSGAADWSEQCPAPGEGGVHDTYATESLEPQDVDAQTIRAKSAPQK